MEPYEAREPDFVYRAMHSEAEATITVDFVKMGTGVTLVDDAANSVTLQTVGEVEDSSAQDRAGDPSIITVTNANCAAKVKLSGCIRGALYEIVWKFKRSDGDVAVAVTRIPVT
ncbi:MAG TPA: hypothetical protein VHK86_03270 [Nitrososphaera sp.]|jgi:hypothetical protein|nr:hypothetical protein [Nitrososphaera sp.]